MTDTKFVREYLDPTKDTPTRSWLHVGWHSLCAAACYAGAGMTEDDDVYKARLERGDKDYDQAKRHLDKIKNDDFKDKAKD